MKSRKLNSGTILIFDTGDEVVSTLTKFAKENRIAAAHFTALGAFSDAGIGFFDLGRKDYLKNQVNEQVEVVSLIGDIALHNCEPKVHAHVVVGKRDGPRWEAIFLKRMCGRRWNWCFTTPANN